MGQHAVDAVEEPAEEAVGGLSVETPPVGELAVGEPVVEEPAEEV